MILPDGSKPRLSDIAIQPSLLRSVMAGTENSLDMMFQRLVYTPQELIISVENILNIQAYEVQRSKTAFGRFFFILYQFPRRKLGRN